MMTGSPIWSSFALVAVSEMGDKTQLLAFTLASRYRRPWAILAGILVATILNHALAAGFGSWISGQLSPQTLRIALAAVFAAFGVWALIPDKDEGAREISGWGAFAATAILFFLAEMGDKTQLATIALGAKYQDGFKVTIGTTLGMMLSDGAAVVFGEQLGERLTETHKKWIRWGAAGLFFAFALTMALAAKDAV